MLAIIGSNENDIVLDFFSGSATTAQAIMELNAEKTDCNRKYILVQLPEKIKDNPQAIEIGLKSNRWNITGDLDKLEEKPTPKYTPSTFGGLYGHNVEDINALLDGGLESLSDDDKKAISNYTNKKNKFAQLENFLASDVFETQNEIQHALSEKAEQ